MWVYLYLAQLHQVQEPVNVVAVLSLKEVRESISWRENLRGIVHWELSDWRNLFINATSEAEWRLRVGVTSPASMMIWCLALPCWLSLCVMASDVEVGKLRSSGEILWMALWKMECRCWCVLNVLNCWGDCYGRVCKSNVKSWDFKTAPANNIYVNMMYVSPSLLDWLYQNNPQ